MKGSAALDETDPWSSRGDSERLPLYGPDCLGDCGCGNLEPIVLSGADGHEDPNSAPDRATSLSGGGGALSASDRDGTVADGSRLRGESDRGHPAEDTLTGSASVGEFSCEERLWQRGVRGGSRAAAHVNVSPRAGAGANARRDEEPQRRDVSMSVREAWSCSGERVVSDVAGVVGANSTTGTGDAAPSGSSCGLAISSSNLSAATFTFSRSWSEKLIEDKNERKSLERAPTLREADATAVGSAICRLEADSDGFLPASVFKIATTAASMPNPARASVSR